MRLLTLSCLAVVLAASLVESGDPTCRDAKPPMMMMMTGDQCAKPEDAGNPCQTDPNSFCVVTVTGKGTTFQCCYCATETEGVITPGSHQCPDKDEKDETPQDSSLHPDEAKDEGTDFCVRSTTTTFGCSENCPPGADCVVGTTLGTCENNKCKVECDTDCRAGAFCDSGTCKCTFVDSYKNTADTCEDGFFCDEGTTCKPGCKDGQPCWAGKEWGICKVTKVTTGTMMDKHECRAQCSEENCSAHGEECVDDYTCTCMVDSDDPEYTDKVDSCMDGFYCDKVHMKCKRGCKEEEEGKSCYTMKRKKGVCTKNKCVVPTYKKPVYKKPTYKKPTSKRPYWG